MSIHGHTLRYSGHLDRVIGGVGVGGGCVSGVAVVTLFASSAMDVAAGVGLLPLRSS